MALKDLFEKSSDLVCVLSADGHINQVNKHWCEALGWSQNELSERSIDDLLDKKNSSISDQIKTTLVSGSTCEFSQPILKKDGSKVYANWTLARAENGLASLIGKQDDVKDNIQKLEYLEQTVDIARVGYGRLDLINKQVIWSDAACDIFGVESGTKIKNYNFFFHRFDPEDRSLILAKHEEAVAEKSATEFQARIKRRGENTGCYVHIHVVAELDTNERPKAFFYVLKDITDYEYARHSAEKATAELNYQATHDELTGLGNRRVFEKALLRANNFYSAKGRQFVFGIVDLDQFKVINDTCGHEAGDNLLQQVAKILIDHSSSASLVVRLGGDEFGIFYYDKKLEEATRLAENLREAIDLQTFRWKEKAFRIGASIGLVEVTQKVNDVSEIVRAADYACMSAKEAGRNCVFAINATDTNVQGQHKEMSWVQRLYDALENDDFVLYSQPIIGLSAPDNVVWEEILLRLRDRKTGRMISPGAFLPAAERYGLSSRIDHWVARQLIKTLQAYSHLFNEDRVYWLNLSGRSICDAKFIEFLTAEIDSAGLKPGTLNFEITETAVVSNISQAVDVINRLKKYGCRFALDDFGSGITSFSYLKNLPVDWIKIDGNFVKNINKDEVDRLFVQSIIDISKVMGMKCVAEFIESKEIFDRIREMGADFGQGYALGEPNELLPGAVIQATTSLKYQ